MKRWPRKTRKSWDEPGHAHFLTWSCYKRFPLLQRDRTRRWVVESFASVRRTREVELWAYVIMPEHVHLLLYPLDAMYEMRGILAALKRPVAAAARKHLESSGDRRWLDLLTVGYPSRRVFRFWQPGGGYDHNIFKEKTVPAVIEYIHNNPVRRGLVDHPADWEWSSARYWDGVEDVPIRMDAALT